MYSTSDGGSYGKGAANTVFEAWFYDNGQTTDAEAGIQFQGWTSYAGTGVVGVLRSSDTTYRVSSITNYDPNDGGKTKLYADHLTDTKTTDTEIARTAGWHQVLFISAPREGDSRPEFTTYLDGVKVAVNAGWDYPGIINAYAGTDENHIAQFKKVANVAYTNAIAETSVEYDDGNAIIAAAEDITNGVLRVVKYTDDNGAKVFDGVTSYTVNCAKNETVSVPVGELDNGQVLMLWSGANSMIPLCKTSVVSLAPTTVVNGHD